MHSTKLNSIRKENRAIQAETSPDFKTDQNKSFLQEQKQRKSSKYRKSPLKIQQMLENLKKYQNISNNNSSNKNYPGTKANLKTCQIGSKTALGKETRLQSELNAKDSKSKVVFSLKSQKQALQAIQAKLIKQGFSVNKGVRSSHDKETNNCAKEMKNSAFFQAVEKQVAGNKIERPVTNFQDTQQQSNPKDFELRNQIKGRSSNLTEASDISHNRKFDLNLKNMTDFKDPYEAKQIAKPGSYGNQKRQTKLRQRELKPGSVGNDCKLTSYSPKNSCSGDSSRLDDILELKDTIQTSHTFGHKKLSLKDFVIGTELGRGKFGKVYLCKHKQTGFICALKVIRKSLVRKQRNLEQLIREVKIQGYLNHCNAVKLYGFFDDKESINLLIEFCMQGQLYSILQEKKRFTEEEARPIIRDICAGIQELHLKHIIHRDIKPENIVLSFGMCKICDFGWSVNCQQGKEKRQTFCGTPLYVSPQLLMGQNYDYKVDIWALGIMVYEITTGRLPFHITTEKELKKIVTNEVRYPDCLSESLTLFIQHLLSKNPHYRNDIATVIEHKFLKEGIQRQK